jgi:hypothetical protein
MSSVFSFKKKSFTVVVFCFFVYNGFSQTAATLKNAGFETFAEDRFSDWSYDTDTTGGLRYSIAQETDSAHSGTGSLKMVLTDTVDTNLSCTVSGSIEGLESLKEVTITAWVKYSGLSDYWDAQFSLQQAILEAPDWEWIDREWVSMWGNDPGSSSWKQISMTAISDTANVFNLIISLAAPGTLWVDDIEITYQDAVPVLPELRKTSPLSYTNPFQNNRIVFSRAMPFVIEACGVNGRVLLRRTGIEESVNLNRLNIGRGMFIVRVKTAEKWYSSRFILLK